MEGGVALQEVRQRMLYRRDDGERRELMDAPELCRQRNRCDAVADFPARIVVGFAKGADHEAACGQGGKTGQALVAAAVEDDMFVDFIGDDKCIKLLGQVGVYLT